MKRLAFKLLLFCFLPLPILLLLNYMVDKGLRQSKSYYYTEWNDIFSTRLNYNLLITGSSRAWVHISPKILDSTLGVNSYNIGLDASHFLMQLERFKTYIRLNKKPDYLIISLDYTSFSENKLIPFRQQFYPYLDEPVILKMTDHYSNSFNIAERYFPLYKYNNEPELIRDGLEAFFKMDRRTASLKFKGYLGTAIPWDKTFDQYTKNFPLGEQLPIDYTSVRALRSMLDSCRVYRIKPILVFSPILHESIPYILNNKKITGIYNLIAKDYHVVFLNYQGNPMTYRRDFFYNSQHLNRKGSEVFSRILANDLRPFIN